MDAQQPDDDDQFPAYDDNRRSSVEMHPEAPDEEPVPSEPVQLTAEPKQKAAKSATSSPKRFAAPGVLGALGKQPQNSALFLTSMGSGAVGGPRGFAPDAESDGGARKQRGKHRRVATDTNNKGADGISNADFLKELNKGLPQAEMAHHKKKSNELKYERDLKHALMKLAESEEQRNTAVEIIGNLEKENDDLKQENDRIHNELTAALTECQILEKSYKTLQETYTHDKREFEEHAKETEMKLRDLQEDIQDKDLALREAEQGLRQRDESIHELHRMQSIGSVDSSTFAMGINTDKEKKLYEKYHDQKRKVMEKDQTIQQLLQKLETNTRMEAEVHRLQDELERTKEEAQEELMNQAMSQKAMESELIALASRNSQFQKEKEELQRLLEEAAIESNQLREHVVRGRTMTNRNLLHQRDTSNMGLAAQGDNLEAMMGDQFDQEDYYEEDYDYVDEQPAPEPPQEEPKEVVTVTVIEKAPEKQVPDVVKEYLHLTASAVKIKHPKVTTIDSEQLIKQVSQFSFWEYHDHMVRIMKNEEKKIEQKLKDEEARKKLAAMQEKQAQASQQQQSSGILGKFRNFWRGSNTATPTSSAAQRHQSVMQKSNKNGGLVAASRTPSKSVGVTKSGKSGSAGASKSGKPEANGVSSGKKGSEASKKADKENVEPKGKSHGNEKDSGKDRKASKAKSKSPAPAFERIENGVSKLSEKMGFGSPHHMPDKDVEVMAQQEFKSIDVVAPSGDEAEDGNAIL